MSRPSSQNTGQPSNATNKAQHEAATNNGYSRTRPPSAEAHREHDFSSILRQQLRGEGRESRSSRSRSVRQRDEQERCAVCDWRQRNGDDDSDSPTILERRTLDTAQGLQDFLDNLSTEPEKPTEGGGAYTLQAVSLPEKVPTRKPLIILYGLNIAFLRTLLASPAVRLDPAFVDAHATRRKYRVTGGGSIVAGCWEYPELTAGLAKAPLLHRNDGKSAVEDGSHGADLRSLSHQEDAAAVFCRASLWAATRVDVLLLSRPVWIDCGGWLKRYRKKVIAWDTELSQRISERGHVTLIDGEETMSLDEELLHDSTVSASTGRCDLLGALEKLAQERWLDLFEVLRPRQRPVMFDGRSLEWYILQSLNRNADMSKALARNKAYSSEVYDWAELVQRLRDHISVLPTVSAPIPALWQKSPGKGVNKKAMAARTFLQAETATMIPIPRQRNDDSAPVSDSDENQRALDRVTYLGAVLLPVSIVSSILSMNETFEPGQRLFWVFWVATVPLSKCCFGKITLPETALSLLDDFANHSYKQRHFQSLSYMLTNSAQPWYGRRLAAKASPKQSESPQSRFQMRRQRPRRTARMTKKRRRRSTWDFRVPALYGSLTGLLHPQMEALQQHH